MKNFIFLTIWIFVCISCSSQKNVFDKTTDTLSSNYFVSFENNIHIFLKVERDGVFADFILWDKYPRLLVSDTLFFDDHTCCYVGEKSTIYSKMGKPYIHIKKDNIVFFHDILQCIENDEFEYKKNIKEKNYAIWHELSIEYRKKTGTNSLIILNEIGQQRNINKKLEEYSFDDFVKEIELCRVLLNI